MNMAGEGLVSVIVPVFNAEQFVCRAIESVRSQTHSEWELILVDDESIDSSASICQRFVAEDPRIRYLYQSNGGPSVARNTGLSQARGEYIYFLDADDFIREKTLEQLLAAYQRHQCDLVVGGFSKLIDGSKLLPQSVAFTPDNIPFKGEEKVLDAVGVMGFVRHFLRYPSNHLVSYCWGRLYRRELIERHGVRGHAEMRMFEDYVLNLEYLQHAERVVYLNQEQYIYTMNSGHASASMVVIQAESLSSDMEQFVTYSRAYFGKKQSEIEECYNYACEIGHCLIHYVIIFLIRTFWQLDAGNRQYIESEVMRFIQTPVVRGHIDCYNPNKGNSRLLPFLIKLRWLWLLKKVCSYKANKRYGDFNCSG